MSRPTDFVRVYSAAGMPEANLVKSMLEAAGMPVLAYGESAATVFGFTVGGMSVVELWVPADRLAEAEEILARFNEPGGSISGDADNEGDEVGW